jgi:hypothetical protein
MASNPYINAFNNGAEQDLIENLVMESIKFYGHDCNYIVRDLVEHDEVYGEAPLSTYKRTYLMDFYIRSFDSYEGDGAYLSKFNLEIRDTLSLSVSLKNFKNEVGQHEGISRPREGDLIHMPMDNRLYVIKYVNKTPVFYQMGKIQFYDLSCEVFEYSSEVFDTGIQEIDNVYRNRSVDLTNFAILTNDGYMIKDQNGFPIIQGGYNLDSQSLDIGDDRDEIQSESNTVLDWTETDPFSEGNI